ncbi:hypothetical protein MCOR30_011645, partial [Pyricularia oryzae]
MTTLIPADAGYISKLPGGFSGNIPLYDMRTGQGPSAICSVDHHPRSVVLMCR